MGLYVNLMTFLWKKKNQGEDGVPGEDGRKVRKTPFILKQNGDFQTLIGRVVLFFFGSV